ncbi:uncharacterized protein LOC109800547 [Cajanus cajan]|nr:uncharacterized protein LOC109800547 [Cajanus cajan]
MEHNSKLVKDPGGKLVNITLFKQLVEILMYIIATRPDIMHNVGIINRYMEKPMQQHLFATKRILRYLKGTTDSGLFYKKNDQSKLIGFVDSDFTGDMDDRKSTTGYVFKLGSGAIAWSSKKQPIVTLSSTEAEYVVANQVPLKLFGCEEF